jgi:ubiquinone biosynthesis protein COQ4
MLRNRRIQPVINWISVTRGLLKLWAKPDDTDEIFAIVDTMLEPETGLVKPERLKQLVAAMSQRRGCEQLFTDRPLQSEPFDFAALMRLPESTLGRVFAEHMRSHRLTNDFFTAAIPATEAHWLNLRIRQTHDLWHVLTDFGLTYAGEVGLQALTASLAPAIFPQLAVSLGTLRAMAGGTAMLLEVSEAIADGYYLAGSCPALLTYRWDRVWDRPLVELRQEIGLPTIDLGKPYARRPGPHPV